MKWKIPPQKRNNSQLKNVTDVGSKILELKTTKKVMVLPKTTFKISATNGENPEKSFEFPLNSQQIFFALQQIPTMMRSWKKKLRTHKEEVLRMKIISAPFAETK